MAVRFILVLGLLAFTELRAQQFRLFSTNLYDFGPAMAASQSVYLLKGTVSDVSTDVIKVTVVVPNEFVALPRPAVVDPAFFDTGEMLKLAYVRQRMQSGAISAGELMSWDEDSRLLYALELKYRRPKTRTITLRDYPLLTAIGQPLEAFALPVGGDVWDCGKPYKSSDATNFQVVFKVYPSSIVRVQRHSVAQTNAVAAALK